MVMGSIRQVLRRRRALAREAELVRSSDWFDAGWYAAQAPGAGRDPARHYCAQGWKAGRDPGPDFSTREYLRRHPDVALAEVNPLAHFIGSGQWEGRWPAGVKATGRDKFPRLKAAGLSAGCTDQRSAVFLVDLVQDVTILRPLILTVAAETDLAILVLVSGRFAYLDRQGIWQDELTALADQTNARIFTFGTPEDAARALPRLGHLISASESTASDHAVNHAIFKLAPPDLHRITLQHGFECLGFRHNRQHDIKHGADIAFAADSVCSWGAERSMTSFRPNDDTKLIVTGPTSLLSLPSGIAKQDGGAKAAAGPGLVCENLHSVRYAMHAGLADEFIAAFGALCTAEARSEVLLRPHPAGAFAANHGRNLPANARLLEGPLWEIDLAGHDYAICSVSSFAIDLLLAGIPTAVWQDRGRFVDTSAYDGIHKVSTPEEWARFANDARENREMYLSAQYAWLESTGLVIDQTYVKAKFLELIN